jgi:hypothetical protein
MANDRKLRTILVWILITFYFSGCTVVGGIFKAGVWVGVIAVLLIVGLILFFVSRGSGKK